MGCAAAGVRAVCLCGAVDVGGDVDVCGAAAVPAGEVCDDLGDAVLVGGLDATEEGGSEGAVGFDARVGTGGVAVGY